MVIKRQSVGVGPVALALALLIVAGAGGLGDCSDDTAWSGDKALDQIGSTSMVYSTIESARSAQSSRISEWNQTQSGFAKDMNETDTKKPQSPDTGAGQETAHAKADASNESENRTQSVGKMAFGNATLARSDSAKRMLVPVDEVSSSDILLDISENATVHIKNSMAISYVQFLHNGNLKTVNEISQALGDAGLSPQDSVVIYGECLPCGGGPAPATLIYWMMRSMGHENVRVLDGTADDWIAAGKAVDNEAAKRPSMNYTARFTDRFIASYDYVMSGKPQVVDARSLQEFGAGTIPGAIGIPYNSVIREGKIAEEAKLQKVFAILDKNRPVVIFTAQPTKGSTAWFALELLGYDAKLYSYQDWLYNQKARSAQNNTNILT